MADRGFGETDLRSMLEDASDYREDHEPGRYVVEAWHCGRLWHVIVEPQEGERVVVVITADAPDE